MGPTAGDPNTTRLYLLFHGYTSTLWERMKWPAKTATRYRTRCRRATTTEEASVEGCARRVLHAATVNGEATSFPRPIRIQGGCGWTQGRPMTRAQPWEFAAVGLQLEMFARYWYSGLTTKCLVNTKKSSPPTVSRLDEKYRRFERRRYRRVLISRGWGNDEKCLR